MTASGNIFATLRSYLRSHCAPSSSGWPRGCAGFTRRLPRCINCFSRRWDERRGLDECTRGTRSSRSRACDRPHLCVGQKDSTTARLQQGRTWGQDAMWNDGPRPREVAGATLGLIGLGSIGRRVAGMARALGMRVIAATSIKML
jgi:lactate dehydrogenase-like 2-hydroxyacid dehydrogenase